MVKLLAAELKRTGITCLVTREPGGTAVGDQIRRLLASDTSITPAAELALFIAARAQLVELVIKPALAKGKTVISDRYSDSTVAYQGYGRGLNRRLIADLIHLAVRGIEPDLTVLLDLPVKEAFKRRDAKPDRIERESVAFHERVRKGYLAMARAEPNRWLVLDSLQKPDANLQELIRHINKSTGLREAFSGKA